MTERTFVIDPIDDVYRRRIETRPRDGVVEAAMEDYIHHFALRLHHDGTIVTAVELAPERTPWSTCADGSRGVASIVGTPLTEVGALSTWIGSRAAQCVHTTDLAVVAAAAAVRGTDRDYEVEMTGIGHPERTITLWIDGVEWATWVIDGLAIVDDDRSGRFAGLALDAPSFSAWMAELLGPEEREPAAVLRRASSIGLGRGLPIDDWHDATEGMNPLESCHTYRAEIVQLSRRNRGSARANDGEPRGTAIPTPSAWEPLDAHA